MRLGFLLYHPPPDYTWSMGRIWTEVIRSLRQRGHDIWIYVPVAWRERPGGPMAPWEGAHVVRVPCRSFRERPGRLRTDRLLGFEFPRRVARVMEPSLDVMVGSAEPGDAALFRGAHRRGILAADWWQGNIAYFLSTRQPQGLRDRLGLALEKIVLPRAIARHARLADIHLPPSRRNGRELVELYHVDPARVVPCLQGYTAWPPRTPEERRLARRELALEEGGFYPVFVGADHVRKGLGVAKEAVKLVRAQGVPARLLHMGSAVEKTPEAIGFGWQTGEMRRRIYAAGDAFVYPTQYESSPMPAREAAAVGLPILTTEEACIEEGVAGADYLLGRRNDPRSFAEALVRLYREPAWAEQLAKRGQRLLAGRTYDVQALDIETALAKVVASRAPRGTGVPPG